MVICMAYLMFTQRVKWIWMGEGKDGKVALVQYVWGVCMARILFTCISGYSAFAWYSYYLHIISSSGYHYSVIMILRNLIQPHTIPTPQATLIPISGRNSYLLNRP